MVIYSLIDFGNSDASAPPGTQYWGTFDIQILAHLVNRMSSSQFYWECGHFAWHFSFYLGQ